MENADEDGSQLDEESDLEGHYDYLLGMTMWTLTKEKKDELLKKRDDKLTELKILQTKSPSSLWKEDLDKLLEEVSFDKI
jgi:DNA topoisomerase-2